MRDQDWLTLELIRVIVNRLAERHISPRLLKDRNADAVFSVPVESRNEEAFDAAASMFAEKIVASGMRGFVLLDGPSRIGREVSAQVLFEPIEGSYVLRVGLCWTDDDPVCAI